VEVEKKPVEVETKPAAEQVAENSYSGFGGMCIMMFYLSNCEVASDSILLTFSCCCCCLGNNGFSSGATYVQTGHIVN
jgi:hypothetical protein